ncbi:MAG: glycosyltransferase family 9 protein [Gemmatimonadaceae bacterium]
MTQRSAAASPRTGSRTSSLVIQTSYLGDTVLTTPLIAELARRGPVDIVTTPAGATLLLNHPGIRAVIPYDKRGADRGVGGFLRVAGRLRGFSYEAAYLAQGSLRSAALAVFAGVTRRVGFATHAGRMLYSEKVEYREDLHHAARLLRLARPGEVPTAAEMRPRLFPGISERGAVDRLLALHDLLDDGPPLVAIAPASVWGTKQWPYYADLARDLAPHARLVIVGSMDDAPLAKEVAAAAGAGAFSAAGVLTLLGSAELIRRSSVLVANDSAPQHLASAVGTPTVTVYGPTVPAFGFGPLADAAATLGVDTAVLPCRPCDRHGPKRCPLGHWRCMRDLPARDVAARVLDILSVT